LRANRSSRTVCAFADFHNTTRGTASKTVQCLVEKKLLQRTRQQADRRIVRIDVTAEGERLCQTHPFADLVQEIARLPEDEQENLRTILEVLRGRIAMDRQKCVFGTCSTCRYLKKCLGSEDEEIRYLCLLVAEPMALSDLDQICMKYKPAIAQA
ncbi:MAG: MarR family winged helix-turn-helix transcriptional regulator, partial [Methyloligellaceae bacterium]